MKMNKQSIALENKIAKYRRKMKLTQAQLAKLANVSESHIRGLENNQWGASQQMAEALAKIFKCKVEDIFSVSSS